MNDTNHSEGNMQEEASKGNASSPNQEYDLSLILDIHLDLSVELGRENMLVNDLHQLGQGSIIELNKSVGEPLEI